MRLYWHPFSVVPRRVRIAVREKGVACEEVQVDLPGGALRQPAFRRLNPFGQVPVLEARLRGQEWLVGAYSLADICYAPFVTTLDLVDLGGLLDERPAVRAWVDRLAARPAVHATRL
jgi:glutathione S-transferase